MRIILLIFLLCTAGFSSLGPVSYTHLTPEADQWNEGSIMDPGNGTTYAGAFWLVDEETLKIRGYWGPFFRTQEWKRFNNP